MRARSRSKVNKRRRKAERRGRVAEFIAALWLTCKGYRVLGHRLRTPFGEVDLAAWKRGVLVIIEVKARDDYDAAMFAVTPWQQQRIARAAEVLAGRWRLTAAPIRFDVIVVGAGFWPRHARGAWAMELAR
jgi:putative endonuclease